MKTNSNKRLLKIFQELNLDNGKVAEMLGGYSSTKSYENSSAKPRIENFIIKMYDLMKTRMGQTKAPPDVSNDDG